MVGWGKGTQGIIAASLSLLLSACGGGAASQSALTDVSLFAQEIGLTAAPSAAEESSNAASPGAPPPAIREIANAKWVDYQNGSDTNDGLTKASAWKHAPGDPEATGAPAAYTPAPGDQIVFAAGSHYYGRIVAQFAGSDTMPVTLTGESDVNRAVIDGSSLTAPAQKCPSQAACNGISAWRDVSVAVFNTDLPEDAAFYAGGDLLTPAQWPDPEDLFYAGEVSQMADVAGTLIAAGAIDVPAELASTLAFEPGLRVAVWVQPNVIQQRSATAVVGGKVLFDASGLNPYLDRPDKFALRGVAPLISIAGEFAILPDRRTVLFKSGRNVAMLTASTGRNGIDLSGANHVVVENLTFQNFSDNQGDIRSGLPVWATRAPANDITIKNNIFCNLFLANGQGAITIQRSKDVTIQGNAISTVADGSGMRIALSENTVIQNNSIDRIGRTAIYLQSNINSLVLRNRIRDVRGVHGNGISVYLGNRGTRVIANTVTESYQPVTIRGNNDADPAAFDVLFANNLLVTNRDSAGAFISFGANGRNIRLYNNVILGAVKGSLRLAELDFDLRVERNVIDGITFNGDYHSDWIIQNNTFRSFGVFQERFHSDTITQSLGLAFDDRGMAPANLAQFCRFISEPLDTVFGTRYDRNVGADFVCP